MLINKKALFFCQRRGYLLFDSSVYIYNEVDPDSKEKNLTIFNGPVKFYNTLVELNDNLSKVDISETIHIYKGYLFPATKFPIETTNDYDRVFVIEKIDASTCFVEEVSSLESASKTIQSELDISGAGRSVDYSSPEITDYLVFVGKEKVPVYKCIDSEF